AARRQAGVRPGGGGRGLGDGGRRGHRRRRRRRHGRVPPPRPQPHGGDGRVVRRLPHRLADRPPDPLEGGGGRAGTAVVAEFRWHFGHRGLVRRQLSGRAPPGVGTEPAAGGRPGRDPHPDPPLRERLPLPDRTGRTVLRHPGRQRRPHRVRPLSRRGPRTDSQRSAPPPRGAIRDHPRVAGSVAVAPGVRVGPRPDETRCGRPWHNVGMEKATTIWMDGELVPWEEAQIHFLTHALHYGTAVFEGIRAYETPEGTAIFRLRDHIDRLRRSALAYNIPWQYEVDELMEACREVLGVNGLEAGY